MLELAAGSNEWPAEIPTLVAAALDSPRAGSIIFGPDLRVLHGTGRLEALLGLKRHQLARGAELPRSIEMSTELDDDSRNLLNSLLRQAVDRTETENSPIGHLRIDGSRSATVEIRRIGRQCWIAIFEDVTSQRNTESNLLNLSLQDALTGLGNRVRFENSLAHALNGTPQSRAALLLIDLDRFKEVNDTMGHPVGDALLRLVGQRLQSVVRDADAVARLGGDEFGVLVLLDPLPASVTVLAERLVDLLRRTYLVRGQVVNVGASVGIAIAPQDGETPESLMQRADLALYQAKASGRDQFQFFEPSMEERSQNRRTLELDLRKALPLGQMEPYYKPRVDVATKSLLAFEAVVRWRHPTRGLLEWDSFSGISDELNLTVQIFDWVLRASLREAAKWPDRIIVSVSAAPGQFEGGHLVKSVKIALSAAAVAGRRLEIAITEDILWRNEQSVLGVLHELRKSGVKVAMERFGSGYASLRQLSIFPFDRVNIDRALLADHFGNARHRAIVRAIASLGASLGISTIVEGIETSAELTRIRSEGCDSVQGYLPGKSVAASELPALIAVLDPPGVTRGSPVSGGKP
jgi:diguanylate cyclase (GGDEF)-like protein